MTFPLFSVHYLYNYYMVSALFSHTHHVTSPYDFLSCDCDTCDIILSYTPPYVVSPKEKKSKVNINNNLSILPSHDRQIIKISNTL